MRSGFPLATSPPATRFSPMHHRWHHSQEERHGKTTKRIEEEASTRKKKVWKQQREANFRLSQTHHGILLPPPRSTVLSRDVLAVRPCRMRRGNTASRDSGTARTYNSDMKGEKSHRKARSTLYCLLALYSARTCVLPRWGDADEHSALLSGSTPPPLSPCFVCHPLSVVLCR